MPRPPIQHHKHIISLAPETLEAIQDVRQTYILGKVARAVGESAKGALSHPAGFATIAGLITAFWIAYFVRLDPKAEGGVTGGRDIERELIGIVVGALPIDVEARDRAASNITNAIRTIRKLLRAPF